MLWLRARRIAGLLLAPLACLLAIACGASETGAATTGAESVFFEAPPRPSKCSPLPPGAHPSQGEGAAKLGEALASARPGEALCLSPGVYEGPLTIGPGVTLWGPRDAVITSKGRGTTIRLEGAGPKLLGVTVDGSGGRFDTLDAAVHATADDAVIEGVRVVHATFGILVEKSNRVVVRHNEVQGDASSAVGLRGDGIRFWETRDSVIEASLVQDSRDLVVWYSSGNQVRANVVRRGRYGTHFMYSHHNLIEDNRYLGNEVGVFIMYSHDLTLERNVMADGSGSAGMGLGVKESGNITARENQFIHDTIGLYLDDSPMQQDHTNLFERNLFRLGDAGVVFHSSQERNTFRGNSLRDNDVPVRVEGGGDALGVAWDGNDFDDYAGFDFDGDGVGDVPYELRSLSTDLSSRYPELAYFRGSPALSLVTAVGEMVPLLAPKTVLRDAHPRMSALDLRVVSAAAPPTASGRRVAVDRDHAR